MRNDAVELKCSLVVRRVVTGAHGNRIRELLQPSSARIRPRTDNRSKFARSLEIARAPANVSLIVGAKLAPPSQLAALAHGGFLFRQGCRVQHHDMLGRKAMPCRVEIRTVIGIIQPRQDAPQIAATTRMARTHPPTRVGAGKLIILSRALHTLCKPRVEIRARGENEQNQQRETREEEAFHNGPFGHALAVRAMSSHRTRATRTTRSAARSRAGWFHAPRDRARGKMRAPSRRESLSRSRRSRRRSARGPLEM